MLYCFEDIIRYLNGLHTARGLETQELLLGFLRIGIRASLPFATMSGGMSVDFVLDTAAISFAVFFMTSPLSQQLGR